MPMFYADQQKYGDYDKFGAENDFYKLVIATPNPALTIKKKDSPKNGEQPKPVKDMATFKRSRGAAFYPKHDKTVLSEQIADWYGAKVNDWILVTVRDTESGHVHGLYTKVDEIHRPGRPRYNELLFRISATHLEGEFEIMDPVNKKNPPTVVRLKARKLPGRGNCYDAKTKLDIV